MKNIGYEGSATKQLRSRLNIANRECEYIRDYIQENVQDELVFYPIGIVDPMIF